MNVIELVIVTLLGLIIVLHVVSLLRKNRLDSEWIKPVLDSIDAGNQRTDRTVREEMAQNRDELIRASRQSREELANTLKSVSDTMFQHLVAIESHTGQSLENLRETVRERLMSIQNDNNRHLEQIRSTVDERLQGTLEKRLGESFKLVSDRLEQVYKGLGEMQALAVGVGDLKRVLTNVKTRGTWGEIQLGAMLQDVLLPDQYASNVSTKGSGEKVEYAVRLPGSGGEEGQGVWLPIDAKFPVEDYQRLMDAQEKADITAAEAASKQLEYSIKQSSADIAKKYLNPPFTTDFAILFLPTEGLFAEVMRRRGLPDAMQRDYRVVIAGPTTLWAILNSIQMGFRTLAVQKRSSEVWRLLAAVKTEWAKYNEILERVLKKLSEASHTVEQAKTRTNAIGRKLKEVEALPAPDAQSVLNLEPSTEQSEEPGAILNPEKSSAES
jgi:DNA recombination protein RmuC